MLMVDDGITGETIECPTTTGTETGTAAAVLNAMRMFASAALCDVAAPAGDNVDEDDVIVLQEVIPIFAFLPFVSAFCVCVCVCV